MTTSQPAAQGSVVSSGTPVKVRAPRVKSTALMRTMLTMIRKPSVATETKCPESRISGAPTTKASATQISPATIVAGRKGSVIAASQSGRFGR